MVNLPPVTEVSNSRWQFLRDNGLFIYGTILLLLISAFLLFTYNQGDALVAINKLRSPFWDVFFKVGTRFAEPVAYVTILIFVAAFSYRRAIFTVVAGALAGIVAGILKMVFAQARPMRWFFDNYEEIWHSLNHFEEEWRSWDVDSSFPSGHATSAFALYSFLAFTSRRNKLTFGLLCFALAFMVAFSRMYLLYHFLRDVTFGAGLGLCIGTFVFFLHQRLLQPSVHLDRGWLAHFNRSKPEKEEVPPT
ncbi:MAG: phosphatase PAP2 family protein [Bacteroidota bacterium]